MKLIKLAFDRRELRSKAADFKERTKEERQRVAPLSGVDSSFVYVGSIARSFHLAAGETLARPDRTGCKSIHYTTTRK